MSRFLVADQNVSCLMEIRMVLFNINTLFLQESFDPVEVTEGLWIVPEWKTPPV